MENDGMACVGHYCTLRLGLRNKVMWRRGALWRWRRLYKHQMLLYDPHLFVLAQKILKMLKHSNLRRIKCHVIPNWTATLRLSNCSGIRL